MKAIHVFIGLVTITISLFILTVSLGVFATGPGMGLSALFTGLCTFLMGMWVVDFFNKEYFNIVESRR